MLYRSGGLLDVGRLRRFWDVLRELPRSPSDVMNHGDPIPGNVLVGGGHLLDGGPPQVFRHEVGSNELEWSRGMALAFEQAVGLAWYYLDSNPVMSAMGSRTTDRILAAEPSV